MTALYAAMQFNREISTFGTQVYPHYFTLSDLTVRDILQSSILQGSERFVFYDMNLIHNVYVTRGIPGMLSLLFITLAMSVIALINTFIFPFLYFASIILIIVLMIMRKNVGSLLFATVKILGLNLGVNILGSAMFALYRNITTTLDIHLLALLLAALAALMVFLLIKIIKSVQIINAPAILSIESLIQKRKEGASFNRRKNV